LKELKGFKKVFLQLGESKKVTITLDRRSLAYYDVSAHAWDAGRGVYRILVGSSSQDIVLQGAVLKLFPAQLSNKLFFYAGSNPECIEPDGWKSWRKKDSQPGNCFTGQKGKRSFYLLNR
jgi:hypothetical protein